MGSVQKNKYLILCLVAVVIMLIQHPDVLTFEFLYKPDHTNDQKFQVQQLSMYSTEQLKIFLSNSHVLGAEGIILAAKELAAKENNAVVQPNNCSNCEESLKHVAKALSVEQARVKKIEGKETIETVSKVINVILILIFGGSIHHLNREKTLNPEKSPDYDRQISSLNFYWIALVSVIALIF
ncbi:hypothetical protein CIK05_00940 [Bdellovibrio sp. qaytius]|nr:hypothetical protein CIK05_00940 [Bdellovibrio sp. qaytius]